VIERAHLVSAYTSNKDADLKSHRDLRFVDAKESIRFDKTTDSDLGFLEARSCDVDDDGCLLRLH
jgi:hypothetical protein